MIPAERAETRDFLLDKMPAYVCRFPDASRPLTNLHCSPGDQHSIVVNPFEEPQKRMSEYTAQEIATLQSRLEKQLGPEYISARSGPSGQKVHYITAEKCIALANEVFGFNGWSSSIQNIQVDFVDEHPQTMKISLGLSVIVRVTLRDGTFHEDIGYGHIENCKGKAAAFEKAKKEGTTDALKRALRNFGNVLGNCIYDKDYLSKVTKMKVAPTKFHENDLHRQRDFAIKKVEEEKAPPVKLETMESLEDLLGEDDFDDADFAISEGDHPDEVVLPPTTNNHSNGRAASVAPAPVPQHMQAPSRQMGRSTSAGNLGNQGNQRAPQTPNQAHSRPGPPMGYGNRPQAPNQPRAPTNPSAPSAPPAPQTNANMTTPGQAGNAAEPVGFFSARAVQQIPESALQGNNADAPMLLPAGQQAFNPKAESPSIRKTPGIDHSSSKPLSRSGQHVPPTASQQPSTSGFTPVRPGNAGPGGGAGMPHPQFSQTRRIGAPGGASSPLANRNSYRPPTMKRPLQQQDGAGRPPLADVSNNGTSGNPSGATAADPKRQKVA
ncbi:recombination protein rad52 [Colletotrichum orchidophilum]|uniref:RAD52 homolog n=1 Tax=Colletotrichum orchidophilum TaxID=1209926 RepID=A0A1G4B901_9PEZI|nr:recombination protein rad52 [Colletotrichum orchidophilum]OHE97907.1 recombination protein rad52 [Colletotrichum orchidophilum]